MTTVGRVYVAVAENTWKAALRKLEPDRDASPPRTILAAGLTYTLMKGIQPLRRGVGLDRGRVKGADHVVDGRLAPDSLKQTWPMTKFNCCPEK